MSKHFSIICMLVWYIHTNIRSIRRGKAMVHTNIQPIRVTKPTERPQFSPMRRMDAVLQTSSQCSQSHKPKDHEVVRLSGEVINHKPGLKVSDDLKPMNTENPSRSRSNVCLIKRLSTHDQTIICYYSNSCHGKISQTNTLLKSMPINKNTIKRYIPWKKTHMRMFEDYGNTPLKRCFRELICNCTFFCLFYSVCFYLTIDLRS